MSRVFRDYKSDKIAKHYQKLRQNQTYDYVIKMKEKYAHYDHPMTIWSVLEKLEDYYDITESEKIIKKNGKRYTLDEVERSLFEKK